MDIMQELEIIKGIHPGPVLERKIKERNIPKGRFALMVNEYPQTLNAIIKGKRSMNTALALRIEQELGLPEGYFMLLQIHHEIRELKRKLLETSKPDLSQFDFATFWDTDIHKIEWHRQKRAVITRVLERGNEKELAEINRFYGPSVVEEVRKEKAI